MLKGENNSKSKKLLLILLTLFLMILNLAVIGYVGYFLISYSEYPFYTVINETVILSMEYLGKRDTLTAIGVVALILLSLSIVYHGLLNYLKD